jgi:hypothetical protein
MGAASKSLLLNAFVEKGQITGFSNPAKIFFTVKETGYAVATILVRS